MLEGIEEVVMVVGLIVAGVMVVIVMVGVVG